MTVSMFGTQCEEECRRGGGHTSVGHHSRDGGGWGLPSVLDRCDDTGTEESSDRVESERDHRTIPRFGPADVRRASSASRTISRSSSGMKRPATS